MKQTYNYNPLIGAFIAPGMVFLPSKDRIARGIIPDVVRRLEQSKSKLANSENLDLSAEELQTLLQQYEPVTRGNDIGVPVQYVNPGEWRKLAGVSNTADIHDTKSVGEFKIMMNDFEVSSVNFFEELVLLDIEYRESTKFAVDQIPKIVVKVQMGDQIVLIRFEASNELAPKFLRAVAQTDLHLNSAFSLKVAAVDPADSKPGKVKGKYVDHNLTLTNLSTAESSQGRPPQGERFSKIPLQKVGELYMQAIRTIQGVEEDV